MDNAKYNQMIQQAFDQASDGYDHPAMRFFDNSAGHLSGLLPLRGGEHILDLATGTGKVALATAQRLKSGKVTGVDLSGGMLSQAGKKAKNLKIQNVSFFQADVADLDFAPATFDGVTCAFGVHFWRDMEKPLKKIISFVKPGGFIAIASFARGSFQPLSDFTLNRFKAHGIRLPETYTWERLDDSEKNRSLLERAGFGDVETRRAAMGHELEHVDAWWHLVCYTGFRSFLNQLSPEKTAQYEAEHREEIQKLTDAEGRLSLNIEVIFTLARAPKDSQR